MNLTESQLRNIIREELYVPNALRAHPYPAYIFERSYVTDVLGLDVPLNESYPYTPSFERRIIQEQLLMEGFFGDILQKGTTAKEEQSESRRRKIRDEHDDNTPYPFRQKNLAENVFLREFSKGVDSGELVWHRDRADRCVKVRNGSGWGLQLENRLPEKLTPGKIYFIPKNTYHRIIRGQSDLVVEIREN